MNVENSASEQKNNNQTTLYIIIWVLAVCLLWFWIWYFIWNTSSNWWEDKYVKQWPTISETNTNVEKTDSTKIPSVDDLDLSINQLWNLDENEIVDIAQKALEEKEKTDALKVEKKKELWLAEDDEIPEELKQEARVFYDKTDKWTLTMNKDLFYTIAETDSFLNPEWYILDEDWNKLYIEEEYDSFWNKKEKERYDFKNSMYAKECVWMKNPLVTPDNKATEVWRYIEQFKNDLKFFSDEAPKFQLSWWLEYLIISLWEYKEWIKDLEWWLEHEYINPNTQKAYPDQEQQFENKIKNLIDIRKDICDVMYNFPIDKAAPKRDLKWWIYIDESITKSEEKSKSWIDDASDKVKNAKRDTSNSKTNTKKTKTNTNTNTKKTNTQKTNTNTQKNWN